MNNENEIKADVQAGEVMEEMSCLQHQISELQNITCELKVKLEPVLRVDTLSYVQEEECIKERLAPLAKTMWKENIKLNEIRREIISIRNSVEL